MNHLIDWWRAERGNFEGECCLGDAAEENTPPASARALARMLVVDAAAGWLADEPPLFTYEHVLPYVAALFDVDDPEAGALWECLKALRRRDTAALAAALHDAARLAAARYAPQAARALAELSYKAALACGSWSDARHAALILERLAELDECPRAAERWRRRAEVHWLRARGYRRR